MPRARTAAQQRKRRVRLSKAAPFPVPIQTVTGETANNGHWFYYKGILVGNSVMVEHTGDMDFLYRMGFFGKGEMSRGQPDWAERSRVVTLPAGDGQNGTGRGKVIHAKVTSRRRYMNHLKWRLMEDGDYQTLDHICDEERIVTEHMRKDSDCGATAKDDHDVLLKEPVGKGEADGADDGTYNAEPTTEGTDEEHEKVTIDILGVRVRAALAKACEWNETEGDADFWDLSVTQPSQTPATSSWDIFQPADVDFWSTETHTSGNSNSVTVPVKLAETATAWETSELGDVELWKTETKEICENASTDSEMKDLRLKPDVSLVRERDTSATKTPSTESDLVKTTSPDVDVNSTSAAHLNTFSTETKLDVGKGEKVSNSSGGERDIVSESAVSVDCRCVPSSDSGGVSLLNIETHPDLNLGMICTSCGKNRGKEPETKVQGSTGGATSVSANSVCISEHFKLAPSSAAEKAADKGASLQCEISAPSDTVKVVKASHHDGEENYKTSSAKPSTNDESSKNAEDNASISVHADNETSEDPALISTHDDDFHEEDTQTSTSLSQFCENSEEAFGPDTLFVVADSDEEEIDNEGTLYKHEKSWQPVLKWDPFPLKENLRLSLEEAFFLSSGLGCLEVNDEQGMPLDLTAMWQSFCERQRSFLPHYIAYHYFRSKNWVPKPGLKFGCNFLLYKDGPPFFHGSYSVVVKFLDSEGKPVEGYENQRQFSWMSLAGLKRITEHVGKELLFCYVIKPVGMTGDDMMSPKCIPQFQVKEVLVSRWVSSQEREGKGLEDMP